ncbi:MAG: NAD+ synthase [Actinobacteria bacterium]|nr:NAD+ synthase [Actinomycetota bacterium]
MRIALCQLDVVVGDIRGNAARIADAYSVAVEHGSNLAVFSELSITGYPPEDLVLKRSFVERNLDALHELASVTSECHMVVGFVDHRQGCQKAGRNAAALCGDGEIIGVYHKKLLPNYGVFDEERLFEHGDTPYVIRKLKGIDTGISICEDMWFANGPLAVQAREGARLIVNINASPYSLGKLDQRKEVLVQRVEEMKSVTPSGEGCAVVYVNQVGGQDELVFDGASMVIDGRGVLVATAIQCAEEIMIVDLEWDASSGTVVSAGHGQVRHLTPLGQPLESSTYTGFSPGLVEPGVAEAEVVESGLVESGLVESGLVESGLVESGLVEAEVYSVLVLGTRDYLFKNGFSDAVIGLSGGIDSSLVAVIAADAVGSLHTHCIAMPSRYSSVGSLEDARLLAENAGIDLSVVPIEDAHSVLSEGLKEVLGAEPSGLADENMQSRIRGIILMAVSNANGWIVLTTGNKSELATGYSTLYGDTAGGFAVIKDVPKTMVYRLARYRNKIAGRELIPQTVLDKPPSAELRPDQRDDQSLPPYDLLDPIMNGLVEQDMSIDELVGRGFDPQIVSRVARLIDLAEYKRRQSPPGIKITTKAFGKDRRVPITNHYRDIPATDLSSDKA